MATNKLVDWDGPVLSDALALLLRDMTTGRNIMFMTDAYAALGDGFSPMSGMTAEKVRTAGVKPRVEKCAAERKLRTKTKAEVFTPAWLVNKMLNALDEEWFGRSPVFNEELDRDWKGIGTTISFRGASGTWQDYIRKTYLEVTCGEAPFITRRYDASTGTRGDTGRRIGVLDRKLKIVAQQCRGKAPSEIVQWALEALRSCYGYEYQGDSLVLARANVLLAFAEFCEERASFPVSGGLLWEACDIVCWNFWQMDGLENAVPGTGERCAVMDWRRGERAFFDGCAAPEATGPHASDGTSRGFLSDGDIADDGPDGDFEPIGQELFVASSVCLLVNAIGRSTLRDDAYAKGERLAYRLACQYYGTAQGFQAVLDRMASDGPIGLPGAGFLGFVDKLSAKGRVTGSMKSSLAVFRDEAYDPMLRLCRDSVELLLRAALYHQRERGEAAIALRDLSELARMVDWSGLPDGLQAKVLAFTDDLSRRDRGGRDFRFLLDVGCADTGSDDEGIDLSAVVKDTGRLFAVCRKWIFGSMAY